MREEQSLDPRRTLLAFYDMTQNRFTPGERRYLDAATSALPQLEQLLTAWRTARLPVCYIVSSRAAPTYEVCHAIAPATDDKVIIHAKTAGFFETDLEQFMRERNRDTLLLSGIALDYGVSSTAREALTLGIKPYLLRDGCFSYDIPGTPVGPVTRQELERAHFASLSFMGAGLISINEILAALGTKA